MIGRRRARLLAHAEHELRGALTALALEAPELDLGRALAALADLEAARSGRRPRGEAAPVRLDRVVWSAATRADLAARRAGGGVHLDWRAGEAMVAVDHARLGQALANQLDNAIEHGGARVTVSGRRTRRGVRIVVSDDGPGRGTVHAAGRGHGLAIAASAARACGGALETVPAERGTAFAIDLPLGS